MISVINNNEMEQKIDLKILWAEPTITPDQGR